MFKQIAKTCRSLMNPSKSEVKVAVNAPMIKNQKEKDDIVVDMMSAVF